MIWQRKATSLGAVAPASGSATPERIPPTTRLTFVAPEPGPQGEGTFTTTPELTLLLWPRGRQEPAGEVLTLRGSAELELPYPVDGIAFAASGGADPYTPGPGAWHVFGTTAGERVSLPGYKLPLVSAGAAENETGVAVTDKTTRAAIGAIPLQRPEIIGGIDADGFVRALPVSDDGCVITKKGKCAEIYNEFESAAGAGLDTGALDLSHYRRLYVIVSNENEVTQPRTITTSIVLEDDIEIADGTFLVPQGESRPIVVGDYCTWDSWHFTSPWDSGMIAIIIPGRRRKFVLEADGLAIEPARLVIIADP